MRLYRYITPLILLLLSTAINCESFAATVPSFPDRKVSVADFGGKGDARYVNTEAFAKAVDALAEAGGGILEVPAGIWLSGQIVLKSNVNLHVDDGAILVFINDKSVYPKLELDGLYFDKTIEGQIFAMDARNVAVTGGGLIDGQGEYWRRVNVNNVSPREWNSYVNMGGVITDNGKYWFPVYPARNRPRLIQFVKCKDVHMKDIYVQNAPMWHIHLLDCENVTVENVTVRSEPYAQNGDGIDIDSSRDVLVRHCFFDVGDDAICLKSGKYPSDGKVNPPCRDVVIEDCHVFHGHGGFVIGSEMSGGVSDVVVRDCVFSNTDVGLRFKTNRERGGVIENIRMENIVMNKVSISISVTMFYDSKEAHDQYVEKNGRTPVIHSLYFRNIVSFGTGRPLTIIGLPESFVTDVTLEDSTFAGDKSFHLENCTQPKMSNVRTYSVKNYPL